MDTTEWNEQEWLILCYRVKMRLLGFERGDLQPHHSRRDERHNSPFSSLESHCFKVFPLMLLLLLFLLLLFLLLLLLLLWTQLRKRRRLFKVSKQTERKGEKVNKASFQQKKKTRRPSTNSQNGFVRFLFWVQRNILGLLARDKNALLPITLGLSNKTLGSVTAPIPVSG